MPLLEEALYQQLVDKTYRRLLDAFEEVDPDVVDAFASTSDVLTFACKNGVRCVLNTQRSVRQLWFAAGARAWHFNYDAGAGRWLDDKGTGLDLEGCVANAVREHAGLELVLPA